MHTIGLLGREFDECLKLLKVRIEDLGHAARVINLTHMPRVTRATIELDRLLYDGRDLFEFGSFYLKEMGIRDPFFHVSYDRDFWTMLRERYLAFAQSEQDNVLFTCNLLEILAAGVPMINHPQSYSHRTLVPFHLNLLAKRGFAVPQFTTGFAEDRVARNREEQIPLNLDEERTWDALSFPKGEETGLRIWREEKPGTVYRLIVVGERLLDCGLAHLEEADGLHEVRSRDLAPEITRTALNAAKTVGIAFGEITVRHSERDDKVWLLQVDPSPDFHALEVTHGLAVSGPLAEYLISVAAKHRT